MRWLMALLAVFALGEAALTVCASGHAQAQPMAEDLASAAKSHAAHMTHDHQPAHDHVMSAAAHGDCEERPVHDPISEGHCSDCATGRSCGECLLLTATRIATFEATQPLLDSVPTSHYVAGVLTRRTSFDPPPPKGVTSI